MLNDILDFDFTFLDNNEILFNFDSIINLDDMQKDLIETLKQLKTN